MKKRITNLIISYALILLFAFVLISCKKKNVHIHNLLKIDSKDSTCTENGNEEYYICQICGKIFKDSKAEVELMSISTILATGHSFTDSYYYDETYHWKECICHDDVSVEKEKHIFKDDECVICHYNKKKPNLLSLEYIEKKINDNLATLSKTSDKPNLPLEIVENTIVINQNGTYDLTNISAEAIMINSQDVKLVFDNTTINGTITFLNSLELCVKSPSLIDSNSFAINGNGNLFICGNKELTINSKTNVSTINCKNIILDNSIITINSEGNGLSSTKEINDGVIYLNNSTYNCSSNGDCIVSNKNVVIKNSHCNFITDNIFVENNEENKEKYNLFAITSSIKFWIL